MLVKTRTSDNNIFEPWKDESLHADGSHPRLDKERGARGRLRLSLRYAAALSASPLDAARAVAEKLRACERNDRCGSGICPPCTGATNRWFRKAATACADTASVMLFATVQLPDLRAMPTYLEELDIDQQKRLLSDTLQNAGLGKASMFGAMDLSLNVWPADGIEAWSVHWALFTPDRDAASFTTAITSTLLRNNQVPVPVKTKVINRTPDKVFSYGFKSVFERKLIPRAQHGDEATSFIRPGDANFDSLAVNLDRIGIMDRFFTQACRFAGGKVTPRP